MVDSGKGKVGIVWYFLALHWLTRVLGEEPKETDISTVRSSDFFSSDDRKIIARGRHFGIIKD